MQLFEDELYSRTIPDQPPVAGIDLTNSDLTAAPSGLGLAPEQAAAPIESRLPMRRPLSALEQQREHFANMGGMDRFFAGLGEFGAAVLGKESPYDKQVRQQREQRLLEIQEFKASTDALRSSMDLIDDMAPEGRSAFAKTRGAQLEKIYPGMGTFFEAAVDRPELISEMKNYMHYMPDYVQEFAKRSPRKYRAWAGSTEGIKTHIAAENKYHTKIALRKAAPSIRAEASKHVPPDVLKGYAKDGKQSFSEFIDMQQYLPEGSKGKLSMRELEAIQEDPETFSFGANLVSPKTENEIYKSKATRKPEGAESTIGKIEDDFKAGRITRAQADAAIAKANKESGVTINMPSSSGMGLNPMTGEQGHFTIGKDGTVRWDAVQPLPKEGNPIQKAIADAIGKGGGKPAAPNPAAAAVDAAKKGAKPATKLPPEIASKLKAGVNTTLSDGSVWTLVNGKPKKVK